MKEKENKAIRAISVISRSSLREGIMGINKKINFVFFFVLLVGSVSSVVKKGRLCGV